MNTRTVFLLSLLVCLSAATAWSQDVPPPPPSPVPPTPPPPPPPPGYGSSPAGVAPAGPSQPAAVPYYPPPGYYSAAPGQPYPYPYAYPPAGPYPGPVVMPQVLVPAPPLPSYEWSVAADAMFLERSSGGSIPLGYTFYNPATQATPALYTNSLHSDDSPFPLVAGMRLEVSRKFDNDITFAGTYWGLQQWSVGNAIYGDPYQETVLAYSPHLQLSSLLGGFDDSLSYTYGSQVENVEFNARFRLNTYDPYWQLDWLCGARYVYFADHLTLTGIDDYNSAIEQLTYSTTNNLIGVQTGLLFVQGWSHFQWEAGLKFGLLANVYHQYGADTASDATGLPAGFNPYSVSSNGCDLSALFEISLALRYNLTDNLALRLGYQFYDITGLALAPRQLGGFTHGGDVAFDGLSIGLQANY